MDMRLIGAGNRQPHRLGAGRQQQPIVWDRSAAREDNVARLNVDRVDIGLEPQVDISFRVKFVRAQRQPILGRAAGEIIL